MARPSPKLLFLLISLSLLSILLLLLLPSRTPSLPRPLTFPLSSHLYNPFPPPPRIAYLISGSDGDGARILRLLRAVYHPRNQYLLHLDLRATHRQRLDLVASVRSVDAFRAAENVNVIGKADLVNRAGSTAMASVLHGAAILLRFSADWDWFVNLEASDYPLITQDDFLHVLSFVPRDFNFIQHTSNLGWKEYRRVVPVIVDPALYLVSRREIFYGSKKRTLPTAYNFFTGSPYMILSRNLVEYSIVGCDNLPRTLLMYFSNMKSSHRGYFHTLACNSKEFKNTIINSDLRFVTWDNPPGEEPRNLRLSDFDGMIESGAVFAGRFLPNDPVLDKIDASALHRGGRDRITPGGWCIGTEKRGGDPCHIWGDPNILKPGPSARRLEKLLLKMMANTTFLSNQCITH